MAITGSWIDDNWELKKDLLEFVSIPGSHTGSNIAIEFESVLDKLKIKDKVNKKFFF